MATDTQAMGLLIRIMPLMMREFALRIEPTQFFSDSGYAAAILDTAEQSAQERLQRYARELRARMSALAAGPPGALRSAGAGLAGPGGSAASGTAGAAASTAAPSAAGSDAPASEPANGAPPAVKYTRTLR